MHICNRKFHHNNPILPPKRHRSYRRLVQLNRHNLGMLLFSSFITLSQKIKLNMIISQARNLENIAYVRPPMI